MSEHSGLYYNEVSGWISRIDPAGLMFPLSFSVDQLQEAMKAVGGQISIVNIETGATTIIPAGKEISRQAVISYRVETETFVWADIGKRIVPFSIKVSDLQEAVEVKGFFLIIQRPDKRPDRNRMPHYEGYCPDPLREALQAITGKEVPKEVCPDGISDCNELDDGETIALVNWCNQNARPHWATGDGVLEAAELLVQRARENNNI